jgi:hypothetical protein
MTKEELLKSNLNEQVEYINKLMAEGQSLSIICKNIGISKSISAKIINHGYVFDKINKQYILEQIKGQETLSNEPEKTQNNVKLINELNTSIQENQSIDIIECKKTHDDIEKIKEKTKEIKVTGRPTKPGRVKANITLDSVIKQDLQIYCIKKRIALSDLLEKLAVEFLYNI